MPRPNQGRERVTFWVKSDALVEVEAARVADGVPNQSEMLRKLLSLGLAEWKRQQGAKP